ncbi:hypothetical protein [Actinocatenispora sera]|uniref:Uncharacterized protein n=1 Tax=Actinocatenispora sera TaxID=390989 RepID=A0A810L660_9ACTN|nr:hypothetical protein [Actinocatenispora sera]BCJ30112.1 hypothetical protein Asera_42200 [Actinocatenispora sera]
MSIWDDLTREEQVVMTTALEECYLNGVIGDYLGHAESGGAVWIFGNDVEAIEALIPRFAEVVRGMIRRDLIEIREPMDAVWDHAPAMTTAEIEATLADRRTWIWGDGDDTRMVMLMTTDLADRLLGR